MDIVNNTEPDCTLGAGVGLANCIYLRLYTGRSV